MPLSGSPETDRTTPATAAALSELAFDARAGLCRRDQKTLPSRWFYDDMGSLLFEAITRLPEYGLTRADVRLLENHSAGVARLVESGRMRVVELGAGGGRKARLILAGLLARCGRVEYRPVDVSAAALDACVRDLQGLITVHPIQAAYPEGIAAATVDREFAERVLILLLGSNIGNFDPECATALLQTVRQNLNPGDALLIGADLVKPVPELIAAYDDASGVTAAFNRNILVRLNREIDARFPVRDFEHVVRFDPVHRRIEMHLRASREMTVGLGALATNIHFQCGETIWTESSYKFEPPDLARMASRTGFRVEACWVDEAWPFAESLWIAA